MNDSSANTANETLSMSDWRPGVLVTGGRDFRPEDPHAVWFKAWLRAVRPAFVLTGGATGVDQWAESIAQAQGVEIQRCPVTPSEWRAHYCIAFNGGPGTADMLRKAELRKLRVINMQTPQYVAPNRQKSLLFD
jgi:hypothetical protein